MAQLTWDVAGKRLYETGIDRGVLYIPDASGNYSNGVAWNGLTAVTETPTGAAATALYADNQKYLNLISIEEFGADIEAYTYPDEFRPFDGLSVPTNGVAISMQPRTTFGLAFRSKIGNDLLAESYGYKLHLIYGAFAAPAQKAYNTINDKPDGMIFKWTISTNPVNIATANGSRATALVTVDSTKVPSGSLTALENILYGTSTAPRLPLPDEVVTLMTSAVTAISLVTPPTYNTGTHVVTIPALTGVAYYIGVNGATPVLATAGAQTAMTTGQITRVYARPASNLYSINALEVTDWEFPY